MERGGLHPKVPRPPNTSSHRKDTAVSTQTAQPQPIKPEINEENALRHRGVPRGNPRSTESGQDEVRRSTSEFGPAGQNIEPLRIGETLTGLRRQIAELQRSQKGLSAEEQKLHLSIREQELRCDRLLDQYLAAGHALELNKKHVREDKERLVRMQESMERTGQEIDSIIEQASRLMGRGPEAWKDQRA